MRRITDIIVPYRLGEALSCNNDEFTYKSNTYYEGYAVYLHEKMPIQKIEGFPVNKIEVFIHLNQLIAISLFLEAENVLRGDIIQCLTAFFEDNPSIAYNQVVGPNDGIVDAWEDDMHIAGLLSFRNDDNLFIQFVSKEDRFLF